MKKNKKYIMPVKLKIVKWCYKNEFQKNITKTIKI